MRLPISRTPKRTVHSLEGLITKLRYQHHGFRTREIVSGLETAISRLESRGLIVRQGGGVIKPTIEYLTRTVDSIRRICLGED